MTSPCVSGKVFDAGDKDDEKEIVFDEEAAVPVAAAQEVPLAPAIAVPHKRRCRLCLEDEEDLEDGDVVSYRSELIAPCQCADENKWVHRECLDYERIYGTSSKAFSQCQICNFDYHLWREAEDGTAAQRWRQTRCCLSASRDCLFVTLGIQLMLVGVAAAVWAIDSYLGNYAITQVNGGEPCIHNTENHTSIGDEYFWCNQEGSIYYGGAVVIVLCVMGVIFCICNCCCKETREDQLEAYQESTTQTENGTSGNTPTASATTPEQGLPPGAPSFYQRLRGSKKNSCWDQMYRRTYAIQQDCALGVATSFAKLYPSWCPSMQCCGSNCCGVCNCYCPRYYGGHHHHHRHYHNNYHHNHQHSSSNNTNNTGGGGGAAQAGGGAGAALVYVIWFVILALIIIFTMIGFLMAMVVLVIFGQAMVQRHYYFMHRQRLVGEFTVLDLASASNSSAMAGQRPRPVLRDDDMQSLRRFGLAD